MCCIFATAGSGSIGALNLLAPRATNGKDRVGLQGQGHIMTIVFAAIFIAGTITLLVAGYITATAEI